MPFCFGSKFDGFWYRSLALYQCSDEDLEHGIHLLQILLNPFLRCIFRPKSLYSISNSQTCTIRCPQAPWPSLKQYCTRNSISSCRMERLKFVCSRDKIPITIHPTRVSSHAYSILQTSKTLTGFAYYCLSTCPRTASPSILFRHALSGPP